MLEQNIYIVQNNMVKNEKYIYNVYQNNHTNFLVINFLK